MVNDSISRRREASDAVRACAVDATEDASAVEVGPAAVTIIRVCGWSRRCRSRQLGEPASELGDLADLVAQRGSKAFGGGEVGFDRGSPGHEVLPCRLVQRHELFDPGPDVLDPVHRLAEVGRQHGARLVGHGGPHRVGDGSTVVGSAAVAGGVEVLEAVADRLPEHERQGDGLALVGRTVQLDPFVELDEPGAAVGPPGVEGGEERVDLSHRGRGAGSGVVGRVRHGTGRP